MKGVNDVEASAPWVPEEEGIWTGKDRTFSQSKPIYRTVTKPTGSGGPAGGSFGHTPWPGSVACGSLVISSPFDVADDSSSNIAGTNGNVVHTGVLKVGAEGRPPPLCEGSLNQ